MSVFLILSRRFDPEDEIGHGLMAVGMAYMLAPAGIMSAEGLRWNIVLFALATLWFSARLVARRQLLAAILRTNGEQPTLKKDAIHVFTLLAMVYMFLLMGSMSFSMSIPALQLNCLCLVALPRWPSRMAGNCAGSG